MPCARYPGERDWCDTRHRAGDCLAPYQGIRIWGVKPDIAGRHYVDPGPACGDRDRGRCGGLTRVLMQRQRYSP